MICKRLVGLLVSWFLGGLWIVAVLVVRPSLVNQWVLVVSDYWVSLRRLVHVDVVVCVLRLR